MTTVEQHIDIDVPVRAAYDQWTQFEEFPTFMEGIESVTQIDNTHLRWVAEIGGARREWDAEITEQHPDHRVAWRSTDGTSNAGVVTFHRLDEDQTRVMVQIDHEPEGLVEKAGSALGFDDRRVKGDLQRFKELVEARGAPTRRLARRGGEPGRRASTGRSAAAGDRPAVRRAPYAAIGARNDPSHRPAADRAAAAVRRPIPPAPPPCRSCWAASSARCRPS